MIRKFTSDQVPDQTGRTALVTGANTGIGFETAKVLAARSARVLLACRNPDKAEDALTRIRADVPDADLSFVPLDLADLASVRAAAERILEEPRLDLLINNAGLMIPPLSHTVDGFELQMGVNHLGPFALTGLLLPLVEQTEGSRIVNTSSNAHHMGEPDFGDLHAERSYSRWQRYGASKLANLLHTYELDRRLRAKGSHVISAAAHPGATATELMRHVPQFLWKVSKPLLSLGMNQPPQGAWPTLAAATHPEVESGQYFGPSGPGEMFGPARQVRSNKRSHDPDLAARLWDVSIELTGVDPSLPPA